MNNRPPPWSAQEDDLIVTDYLTLLRDHTAGVKINKAKTRRALLPLLNQRSETSVEFKRMNISAVLESLGRPWLPGYRPAKNYQRSLAAAVTRNPLFKV